MERGLSIWWIEAICGSVQNSMRPSLTPTAPRSDPSQALSALPRAGVGHAGPGFGRRQPFAGLQQLDGDAVRRADEGHAAVTRRAVDRHAVGGKSAPGVVD